MKAISISALSQAPQRRQRGTDHRFTGAAQGLRGRLGQPRSRTGLAGEGNQNRGIAITRALPGQPHPAQPGI